MNEKSFEEIQNMTPAERREYYKTRAKETNNQPMKKVRKKTRKLNARKSRRIQLKEIREHKYDRPFAWNPQFNPKVMDAVKRKRNRILRGMIHILPTEQGE